MSPMGLPLFLLWIMHQTGTETAASSACPDKLRMDLSVRTSAHIPEVCIRPGQLTGFLFDRPASVDLEEEIRFSEVLRGPRGISFVPPAELTPGERLRLTVHFAQDPLEQRVTFMLISSAGRATHQVDVFHDARSRESLWLEIGEERRENQQLRVENQSLRRELTDASTLRRAYLREELLPTGMPGRLLPENIPQSAQGRLKVLSGTSYRTKRNVAVLLVIRNEDYEPWTLTAARLTDEREVSLRQLEFGQVPPLPYLATTSVLVEAVANQWSTELTLTLSSEDARSVTVPHIQLP